MTAQTILPANTLSGGYDVANSLRFNSGSSDYLTKTVSSGDDMTAFTFSFWVKRSTLGTTQRIISSDHTDSKDMYIRFESNDQFGMYHRRTDSENVISGFQTAAVFKDTSAWYHFVINMDSTESTEADRIKMYVNGTRVTTFAGTVHYPTSGEYANFFNSSEKTDIGYYRTGTNEHFDGYLAEVVAIQGTAYQASDFGEFDEDSPTIWKPKDVSGLTFGTNGFYHEFKQAGTSQNSSGLGADTSGNDNHFAVNNLTANDQSTDTCTNNFCTLNPLTLQDSDYVLSQGNLRISIGGDNERKAVLGTFGMTSGKWYWEVMFDSTSGPSYAQIGISDVIEGTEASTENGKMGYFPYDYGYRGEGGGKKTNNGTYTNYGASYEAGDTIGVAVDLDNNAIYFSKDGAFQASGAVGDPTSGSNRTNATFNITAAASTGTGAYFPAIGKEAVEDPVFDFNFGSPSYAISSGNADGNGHGNFEYAVPSGYLALCTKNLAENG